MLRKSPSEPGAVQKFIALTAILSLPSYSQKDADTKISYQHPPQPTRRARPLSTVPELDHPARHHRQHVRLHEPHQPGDISRARRIPAGTLAQRREHSHPRVSGGREFGEVSHPLGQGHTDLSRDEPRVRGAVSDAGGCFQTVRAGAV